MVDQDGICAVGKAHDYVSQCFFESEARLYLTVVIKLAELCIVALFAFFFFFFFKEENTGLHLFFLLPPPVPFPL